MDKEVGYNFITRAIPCVQVLYAAIAGAAVCTAAFVGIKDFGFFSSSSVGDVVDDDQITLGWVKNRTTGWWDGTKNISATYVQSSDAAQMLLQGLHSMNDVNALGFGHQYSNYQGQKWPWFQYWGQYDKSDVYNDTHDYPLVFGYDLQDYLKGHSYEDYIIWAGENGAVVSFSWLADNPACVYYNQTDKAADACDAYNNTCFGMDILAEIMPGGKLNHIWTSWLDDLSTLFDLLKFSNGDEIPFVLRLFHECTASKSPDYRRQTQPGLTIPILRLRRVVLVGHQLWHGVRYGKGMELHPVLFAGREGTQEYPLGILAFQTFPVHRRI